METKPEIRIGSRESKLAVIQSEIVQRHLQEKYPEGEITLITMKTTGDKILDRTLDKIGGKGLFVKELDLALMEKRTDLSVHSLKDMPIAKLTFYVLLFGLSVYVVRLKFCTGLQPIPTPLLWVNAVSLAVFPTVISLVTMTKAIHYIGSTPTAILGALEPVTALFFGVLIFGEQLTPRIILGILMVITAVTLIIGGKTLLKKSKIRLRHTGR